ncbi:MAG: hypothetical protein A3K19_22505 [Lentisphaerae bacterium RIFOXYB12_FULL_65_16]|nr:MAG: hypothetical protein A3K18_08935 [Lentisphaerae bacterium RIFOXYA12_64_32]OGV93841.1 MAG: hypothetical protein A3K19_22505 [Lentisphaerae bacterium RIFOXYB12_FULL_65_16]
MEFAVAQEVRRKTNRCESDFACLACQPQCLCPVVSAIDGGVLFIEPKCEQKMFCTYRMQFGNGTMCTCPTRKELYHRYRV